jgi:hypothetical protein
MPDPSRWRSRTSRRRGRSNEKLGFVVTFGAEEANYLILKNGESTLGLFFIMLDTNILTFNPGSGWNGSRPTPMSATSGAASTKRAWI